MGLTLDKFPNPDSLAAREAARQWVSYFRSIRPPGLASNLTSRAVVEDENDEDLAWYVFWESLALRDRQGKTRFGRTRADSANLSKTDPPTQLNLF
jgi:hypothetical protein